MKDALGTRMKEHYEHRARTMLPRRTYTIVRLDGRAFHTYTRGLDKPYDQKLMDDLAFTARALVGEVSGARFAYCQSDEISLLLTDFENPTTEAWFGGNQQKIVSLTAALATAVFNAARPGVTALFDSRAFTIPDPVEVENYFIWRQQDAVRNSILAAGQAKFSHSELAGKNTSEIQEMLWVKHNINWDGYDPRFKRGTWLRPDHSTDVITYTDKRTGQESSVEAVRKVWVVEAAPRFTKERDQLQALIPRQDH